MVKELQYPFDSVGILKNKRGLRKQLLGQDKNFISTKIAILSGSTIGDIKKILELFLLNYGIKAEFYEGEYNRFYEESVFPNPELKEFAPDIIYIHTSNKNIEYMPDVDDSEKTVENKLDLQYQKYHKVWEAIKATYKCPIIQNNFEPVSYRVYGNSDVYRMTGELNFINHLNAKFYEYAAIESNNLYINDINYLASWVGLQKWADNNYWYSYKYALHMEVIPDLCYSISNIIKSLLGKNKKSIVLDLDNTLWGGIIGDDGVDNLKLGIESAQGMAFEDFQVYLKKLKKLGVMLNVNSKNDKDIALKGFEHPASILKVEDFVKFMANWEDKHLNLQKIVKELNIMPDSFVFVDDNPVERGVVSSFMPDVEVLDVTTPEEYRNLLDKSAFFEVTVLSEDDKKRVEMYKQNQAREEMQASFEDYADYLKSLKMTSHMQKFDETNIARVTQLVNKTNQFNLTTQRFVQTEIEKFAADEQYITICADLNDRFGSNGIVSVLIARQEGETAEILLWLMSCRVFKRDLEFATFDMLIEQCKKKGISLLKGHYIPTKKNKLVSGFYEQLGFEKTGEHEGGSFWEYKIPEEYKEKNNVIEVERNE